MQSMHSFDATKASTIGAIHHPRIRPIYTLDRLNPSEFPCNFVFGPSLAQ